MICHHSSWMNETAQDLWVNLENLALFGIAAIFYLKNEANREKFHRSITSSTIQVSHKWQLDRPQWKHLRIPQKDHQLLNLAWCHSLHLLRSHQFQCSLSLCQHHNLDILHYLSQLLHFHTVSLPRNVLHQCKLATTRTELIQWEWFYIGIFMRLKAQYSW